MVNLKNYKSNLGIYSLTGNSPTKKEKRFLSFSPTIMIKPSYETGYGRIKPDEVELDYVYKGKRNNLMRVITEVYKLEKRKVFNSKY